MDHHYNISFEDIRISVCMCVASLKPPIFAPYLEWRAIGLKKAFELSTLQTVQICSSANAYALAELQVGY